MPYPEVGEAFAHDILETVDLPLLALDSGLRIDVVNDAFLRYFEVTREETLGRHVYELGDGQWDIPALRKLLGDILEHGGSAKGYRVEHRFERIGRRVMRLNAKRISRSGSDDSILLAISDDTERERLRFELEGRIEFADKLIDSVREALLILHWDLHVHSANHVFYDLFKVDRSATEGRLVYELGNGQWNIPELRRLLVDILPKAETFDDYEVHHTFEGIGPRVMLLNARRLDHLDLIILAIRDITEQRATEQARNDRERRQQFLLELSEVLRSLADPNLVQSTASEFLGRYLEADRVAYAEIDETGKWSTIARDWNRDAKPSHAGRRRLTDYGEAFIADLRRGQTIVIENIADDPRTNVPDARRTLADRSISSLINVPLMKEGRLAAVLAVHSTAPRAWRRSEILLAEQVGERTWSAVERARADAALRESEERLRLAQETAGIGTWDLDLARGQTVWSPQLFEMLGVDPTCTPSPQLFFEQVHPDDRASVEAAFARCISRGKAFSDEFRVCGTDGTTRYLMGVGKVVQEVDGKPTRMIGINYEVTERKTLENERAFELEATRRLLKLGTISIREQDFQPLLDEVVDAAIAFTGADFGNLQLIDPETGDLRIVSQRGFETWWLDYWNNANSGQGTCGTALEQGQRIIVEDVAASPIFAGTPALDVQFRAGVRAVQSTPLVGWTGRAIGMFSTHHRRPHRWEERTLRQLDLLARQASDILERKQAEARLRAAHDTFRRLVDRAPFGIYAVDADFRLVQVSEGARHAFASVRPLIGRDFAEVLHAIWPEPFASEAINRFRHTLATGETYHAPSTIERRADKDAVEAYDWRIERLILPDGRPGVVCHFYDFSERQRHEEHVQLLMREVNHRSKNMLSLIQAIAHRTIAASKEDFLARFDERIQSLAAAQDLLVKSDWKAVPLVDLVRTQLGHFADLIGTRITLKGPPLLLTSQATQAFAMALHELATNAAKYGALSNDTGHIDIFWGIEPIGGGAPSFEMRWLESGGPLVSAPERSGFGSTVIGQVLEMSVSGSVSLEYAPAGVTWRLICDARNILEGGKIPLHEVTGSAATEREEGLRVLIVEDEPLLAADMGSTIEDAGFTVLGPVGDVARALALIERQGCDAAVLDANLRGETSEPVARRLSADGTPFVVVTGYGSTQLPDAFRAAPLLTKPIRESALLDEMQRFLDASEKSKRAGK